MIEWVLILTVGLPRSGKSTWAHQQGCPVVNRDAIRLALYGQAYIQQAEDMVSAIESYMVTALFTAGHKKVIVDATHLKEKYRKRWESIGCRIEFERFNVPKRVCIERAIKSGRKDLIPIIERMAENVEWPNNRNRF